MPLHLELANASVPLLDEVEVLDKLGRARHVYILGERSLTTYLDKRELATLTMLGGAPEMFVLDYLRNQHLVSSIGDIASTQVDWETESVAVFMCAGIADLDKKTACRTVTTGYGQGTALSLPMDRIDAAHLPPDTRTTQTTLYHVVDAVRLQQSIYRQAGSVYGYVLFDAHGQLLHFTEDMGCHNAVDTIAGRMWLEDMEGGNKVLHTADRLTSETAIKGTRMGIPSLLSYSGATQMGHQIAQRVSLMLSTRYTGRYFLSYTGQGRFVVGPGVAGMVGPCGELLQVAESGC